ncbi:hypothetical protein ALC53_09832 [Atta colombica]|uniref:Uncharacterized protein n=1 Tax=Atta colombica TaxID=520822 RepID=A0A195B635_9HYME|nr:hypothetical protein ALC53_09832 [Atta colombica]
MITNIRTTSSIISFKADTLRIKISGTNVVQRPVGDTSGISNFRSLYHVTFVIFLYELYLHKCDEQEETVAVATELFEQEQGLMRGIDENYSFFAIILLRGWLIITLLMLVIDAALIPRGGPDECVYHIHVLHCMLYKPPPQPSYNTSLLPPRVIPEPVRANLNPTASRLA